MKKIGISIAVHEQPFVVRDFIENIKKFVPNSCVVLHVSADSPQELFDYLQNISKTVFDNFLYVNQSRFHTYAQNEAANVTGLSTVHCNNFKYLKSKTKFDCLAINTSNDMFVRKGVENIFNKHICGCPILNYNFNDWSKHQHHPNWIPVVDFFKNIDSNITKLTTFEKQSSEGTFYPFDVFDAISNIVIDKIGGLVKYEEILLPTLAFNLYPNLYENVLNDSYVFHNYMDIATKFEDIDKVRRGELPNKYVVKRVPRKIDDPCRIYINNITMKD